MCQLLAMNANVPTDICFSFTGFQKRGGATDVHKDGWGIAFFEGNGVRTFLDAQAAAQSPLAELVRRYPIKSKNIVAHIRKATRGEVALVNTHPFLRELWGHYWIFAHNGTLDGFKNELHGAFRPAGTTDSELAFCWILQELRARFGETYPGREALFKAMTEFATTLSAHGEFNFLLANGELLIAHCSTNLAYVVRKAPFATARLKDEDVRVDFSSVTSPRDRVAVIATQELTTDEAWTRLEPGTIWLFDEGDVLAHAATTPGPAHKVFPR